MPEKKTQLVVIGAGPGGYAAAFHAADLGLEVTLIDPNENPGGVCLYHGCIPTKALLHFADVKDEAHEALQWGLDFRDMKVDIDRLRNWKNSVVTRLTRGLGHLTQSRKIQYIRGTAVFLDASTLEVTTTDKQKSRLKFKNAIIATGARSRPLPGVAFDHQKILSSRSALKLETVPEKFLVVGAGYIGLEMAVIYKALGSTITIMEATADMMPGADKDLVDVLRKEHRELLKGARFSTKVVEAVVENEQLKVTFEKKDGKKETETFDKMLVAIGMIPNSEQLGLDKAGVEKDDKGFIPVNLQRQTNHPHIYAIGDVAGEPLLAHKASHEGRIAAEHIAGHKVAYEPKVIPAIVYVGLAWVGLTETMAEQQGRKVKITRFPWVASGRAIAMGRRHGLTKLIIDPATERILGAGFAGYRAEDLVPEMALAIEMGAVARDLELTIHPHPTLSETIMEAAEMYYGQATHALKH